MGLKTTSVKTTQTISSLPIGTPISKVNEVFDWMRNQKKHCCIHDIKGDGNQVHVRFDDGTIKSTEINLSYKVYAPCCVNESTEWGWCPGNQQCHHCQCGCNGDWGTCSNSKKREGMWSHNVVAGVVATVCGAQAAAIKRIQAILGNKPMQTTTLKKARELFLHPIVTRLATESIEAAVLEVKNTWYAEYPKWPKDKPIPVGFSGDARWNKPYGHNALDGTVYAKILIFGQNGEPFFSTRSVCFAGTYHRDAPGQNKRIFVKEGETAFHGHAGAMDPVGLGWAAFELMKNYGFDLTTVLHDRDGSGMKEVRRVKKFLIDHHPELGLSKCVCNGNHFIEYKPTKQAEIALALANGTGRLKIFCEDGGGKGGCFSVVEQNCLRHSKVSMRKGPGKALTRLLGVNQTVLKRHDVEVKRAKKRNSDRKDGLVEELPAEPILPHPALKNLPKTHELHKKALSIGKYITKVHDISLILANGDLEECVALQPCVFDHCTGNHSSTNKICQSYEKCLMEDYEQSMVLNDPATKVVIKDVLDRHGTKKHLSRVIQRLDTNSIEHLNSFTKDLLPKGWSSHNTTVYQIIAKCVLLFDNEGGWIFIRLILEHLGIEVTRELSNYITTLEAVAGRNMDRKNSNEGKRQRTACHQGRREQVADVYKQDWDDSTKPALRKPGAAIIVIDTTDVDSDSSDDDNDVPSVEEREERESLQVLGGQSFVDLTYEENKAKRELDVPQTSSSSGGGGGGSSNRFFGEKWGIANC